MLFCYCYCYRAVAIAICAVEDNKAPLGLDEDGEEVTRKQDEVSRIGGLEEAEVRLARSVSFVDMTSYSQSCIMDPNSLIEIHS